VLSREPGITPRTVAKGRTRATVADMKTGPTEPRSTVLTEAEARTVAKGRTRATVADMKTGPTEPRSTVLTEAEAAMIVAFRRHTLLPLGDCLYVNRPSFAGDHLVRVTRPYRV
jgi:hypothetical protein